ncbi:hypothetical protein V5F77_04995 [Xanthobacter sp. DSM 24535]|uniref:hypothetical protein n=1 Tax=Roseixanthobacter psychrophilus TaxID=3119917 RepID=UPI00372736D3
MTMTMDEALKLAAEEIEVLLRSGDEAIFSAAERLPDGRVDTTKLAAAMARATERLASVIFNEANETLS